jgi:hypothetical protein
MQKTEAENFGVRAAMILPPRLHILAKVLGFS